MIAAAGFVVAAGAFALLRSSVISWLNQPDWPWGTLAVNTVGSLAAGVVVAQAPQSWSTIVGIAALGALTTFSTFAVEVVALAGKSPLRCGAYVAATTIGAVGAAVAGLGT
ncbi:MAG: hypothetical protein GY812_07360 [Actinomycetia bacterium]|nr:hypothetical protein [Actinomycetes bacterium]